MQLEDMRIGELRISWEVPIVCSKADQAVGERAKSQMPGKLGIFSTETDQGVLETPILTLEHKQVPHLATSQAGIPQFLLP